MRWIRWGLGVLLAILILGAEIEEGHGIHIALLLVSGVALAGVAWCHRERPLLSVLFAVVGVSSFAGLVAAHCAKGEGARWVAWASAALAVLIFVFLGRRLFQGFRRP